MIVFAGKAQFRNNIVPLNKYFVMIFALSIRISNNMSLLHYCITCIIVLRINNRPSLTKRSHLTSTVGLSLENRRARQRHRYITHSICRGCVVPLRPAGRLASLLSSCITCSTCNVDMGGFLAVDVSRLARKGPTFT